MRQMMARQNDYQQAFVFSHYIMNTSYAARMPLFILSYFHAIEATTGCERESFAYKNAARTERL